jgi:hypothetical protein
MTDPSSFLDRESNERPTNARTASPPYLWRPRVGRAPGPPLRPPSGGLDSYIESRELTVIGLGHRWRVSWWHRPRDPEAPHRCLPISFHWDDRFFWRGARRALDGRLLRTLAPGSRTPPLDRTIARHDERAGARRGALLEGTESPARARPRARSVRHARRLRPRSADRPMGATAAGPAGRTEPAGGPDRARGHAPTSERAGTGDDLGRSEDPLPELPGPAPVDRHRQPRGVPQLWTPLVDPVRNDRDGRRRGVAGAAVDPAPDHLPGDRGRCARAAERPSFAGAVRGLGELPADPVPEVPDLAATPGSQRVCVPGVRTDGPFPQRGSGGAGSALDRAGLD